MDYDRLKQKLVVYSQSIGVDKLRITTADPFFVFKRPVNTTARTGLCVRI